MHMILKFCCSTMLLDKNWNHTRKEKWWNLSIFNLYFLAKFCKRDWGDLQKTTHVWLQRWRPSYYSRLFRVQWSLLNSCAKSRIFFQEIWIQPHPTLHPHGDFPFPFCLSLCRSTLKKIPKHHSNIHYNLFTLWQQKVTRKFPRKYYN